jgi:DNA topoisomerase-1
MAKKSASGDRPRNLVIVESPAKAKTIEGFLGTDFLVRSSYGHIRDLNKSDLCIDLNNGYKPQYTVSDDKKALVEELRKLSKEAEMVWLASDEDREGEAISWHIYDELKLPEQKTRRIVFHEITKPAILKAIENPRQIDANLVDAQQARRVLDRLVGYELSPILWKKVKPSLSAGRVQSVAVRLLVEREREVQAFSSSSAFRVVALLDVEVNGKKHTIKAVLPRKLETESEALAFLEACRNASVSVNSVEKKPARRTPAAPFTTSTLQQEAARKLGYSVSQTMVLAQRLYEAGKITYMRTDSVNLSETALEAARKQIQSQYGPQYHKERKYTTKSKGAQEAHEAIRPTYMDARNAGADAQENKLYELIWKRTLASQMADAELEKTTIRFAFSGIKEMPEATGEVIVFDGFLKVYTESFDEGDVSADDEDSGLLPPVVQGQAAQVQEITATERFNPPPPRYTEASLVKKLEELGIGRPSTYAPTISTIQKRNYVVKEDRAGTQRNYRTLLLKNREIKAESKTEVAGTEKAKLFPTDIGAVVNDFLLEHFDRIMDYHFTAQMEKEFDEIAEGVKNWSKMIDAFYKPFHADVEKTLDNSERATGRRELGTDPQSGKKVSVRIGRYGALAQIGEDDDEAKKFASLRTGQSIETITLEEALELFRLPREVGVFEGKPMVIGIGRFGPYIRHNNGFVSIPKTLDPLSINSDQAIEIIEAKRLADAQKVIAKFDVDPEIQVLNGRFGPYITRGKDNFKIPKGTDPHGLSLDDCLKIIEDPANSPKAKPGGRKAAPAKKAPVKASKKK